MRTGTPLLRPGLRHGSRPEQAEKIALRRDTAGAALFRRESHGKLPGVKLPWRAHHRRHLNAKSSIPWLMAQLADWETHSAFDAGTPDTLITVLLPLRRNLRKHGMTEPLILQSLAVIRAVMRQSLGIVPHPEQLFGAWAMLQGSIVEMATGEGKTVTAGMVAASAALAGVPVHVLTVNDYLVQRDADSLDAFYRCFGLTTGMVTATMPDAERRSAYAADIVYVTSKQIVFDYLRDVRTLEDRRHGLKHRLSSLLHDQTECTMLRGLCLAIVDEADSVLIDEARTPLILAEARSLTEQERTEAAMALAMARSLTLDTDFTLQPETRSASLTDAGQTAVVALSDKLSGRWRQTRYRTERVLQALVALHVYQRDRHYLVADDSVLLIDEGTGRTLPDRKLQHGVHQMLELKERCSLTAGTQVAASLSFQRFFGRYGTLCGMSGTVYGVRRELRRVYRSTVVPVPLHMPCQRREWHTIVTPSLEAQLRALLHRIANYQRTGQPVLVGTRTVALSEIVSRLLSRHGITHALLNAHQDAAEASVVAAAGQRGAVTVATNMAGRGTDIALGEGVAQLGGLHVINLEVNDSRRVDRQLFGRAARQGDPGSCEALLSLDDDTLQHWLPKPVLDILKTATQSDGRLGQAQASHAVRWVQRRLEKRHAKARLALFRGREAHDRLLSLAGDAE